MVRRLEGFLPDEFRQIMRELAGIREGSRGKSSQSLQAPVNIFPSSLLPISIAEAQPGPKPVVEERDPQPIATRLLAAIDRVGDQVVCRDELLTQTTFALLTRGHQMLFSQTGMAKTLYAKAIFEQFSGATTYRIQAAKGDPADVFIGPLKMSELREHDRYMHATQNTLVDADLAYLDEFMDANNAAIRTALGVLEERELTKGEQHVVSPLHTAIAVTNYLRLSDITEAALDRFMFKATLYFNPDPYALLRINKAYGRNSGKVQSVPEADKFPFADLKFLSSIVGRQVPGQERQAPQHILFMKDEVIKEYLERVNKGRSDEAVVKLSPRTIAKARDVLDATALLGGRRVINLEDLNSLKYVVCTINDERTEHAFAEALKAVAGGITRSDLEAINIIMLVDDILDGVLDYARTGTPLNQAFVDGAKQVFKTELAGLTFDQVKAVVTPIQPTHPSVQKVKARFIERVEKEQQKASTRGQNPVIV